MSFCLTRRRFAQLCGAIPLSAAGRPAPEADSAGIGVQTFCFRDRPLDEAIQAIAAAGVTRCEIYQRHMEPRLGREELRQWRTTVSLDGFRQVRDKLSAAGLRLDAYYYNMRDDATDEEIARGFQMAAALGTGRLTSSCNVTTVRRIAPFALQAGIRVGLHNHSNLRRNELASPESFIEALENQPPLIGITLDVGHFAALGFDAPTFIAQHRRRIFSLHIKDRKKNNGPDVPFGQGDTPIKEVLRLAISGNPPLPAYIECEYESADPVAELRRSLEYCRRALAS